MGALGNTGGRAKQKLWRTDAMALARAIKSDMARIISRISAGSGSIWIEHANRKPGDPYKRPREWSEYIENRPEVLRRTADELDQIARAAAALAKSFQAQAGRADAEIAARRKASAVEIGRFTAERMRQGV